MSDALVTQRQLEGMLQRLNKLDQRIGQTEVRESRGGAGTTFPTGISAGFRFFRTDLGYDCYYDGTRWLTAHEYSLQSQVYSPTVPGAAFYAGGTPANLGYAIPRSDFSLYMTRWVIGYISDTNQSGVNYWTLILQVPGTTITTQNTQNATVAGGMFTREGNDNTVRAPQYLRLQASAKNGAPGGIWAVATWYYRLVII